MTPTTDIGDTPVPREVAERHADPTIELMLKRGLPLTRNTYLDLEYGPELPMPDEWTAEHEAAVPEIFRDPDAVRED